MSRIIAFFDFDGTITKKDSLLEFIKYSRGVTSFYVGLALNAPVLIAYKLQIMSNQRAKEIILRYFFGKMPLEEFNRICEVYSREVLPSLIRPKALKEISKLKEAGAEVVVISASPENWVNNWSINEGLSCIATKLVTKDNMITGRINGLNCHGSEKVRRIREEYQLDQYSSVYCYGDNPADKAMLSLGNYRFYKPFR